MSGIPSVGFIDSDLEFYDSFYPILGNNDNKASDFFLLISFISVIKNVSLKLRLKFLAIKLKYFQFCFRFYFYLLLLKYKKKEKFYLSLKDLIIKKKYYFNENLVNSFFFKKNTIDQSYLGNIQIFLKRIKKKKLFYFLI